MARIDENTAIVARAAYDSMENSIRESTGERIVRTKDDAPEWVRNLVYEAHGDLLPDDWRYDVIRDALDRIADSEGSDESEVQTEFSDEADVYNADLLKWVGSHSSRGGYVDEAKEEFGEGRDFYHSIQMGQYVERGEVFASVLSELSDIIEYCDECVGMRFPVSNHDEDCSLDGVDESDASVAAANTLSPDALAEAAEEAKRLNEA